jgi:hypothetical protein
MPNIRALPFGAGFRQSNDDRLQEPGVPRDVVNLIKEKNGRMRVRYDYDALNMNSPGAGTNMQLFDLHNYSGRLIASGSLDVSGLTVTDKVNTNLFEFVNSGQVRWQRFPAGQVPLASELRDVGRVPFLGVDVTAVDVAAGNGLVAVVYGTSASGSTVHIFNAQTGATVVYTAFAAAKARVVCTGTIFFFVGTQTSDNSVVMSQYDPATASTLIAMTAPDGANANAIRALDMSLSHEGTSFWLAYCRTGSTSRFHGYNTAGTQTNVNAGPAELIDGITIFTEATVGGTQRVHLARVINGSGNINLTTFTSGGSVTETATANVFGATTTQQVALSVRSTTAGNIWALFQNGSNVIRRAYLNSTHTLTKNRTLAIQQLNSKLLTVRSFPVYGFLATEGTNVFTSILADLRGETIAAGENVAVINASVDRLLAHPLSAFHLPNLAHDATTGRVYWARCTRIKPNTGQPIVTEMQWATTRRRQSAQLGSILYIAGGNPVCYDGKRTGGAGGMASRPRITAASGTVGGSLTLLGTYQFVPVLETYDSQGQRIQSAVGDIVEVTLTGAQNQVNLNLESGHFFWGEVTNGSANAGSTSLVVYRTRNTADGNLTFFRDFDINTIEPIAYTVQTSTQSDIAISANETLYSQGSRGALSGPLEFNVPEPFLSITPSADKLLTGGLPRSAAIQESRPHLESEQVNWNDSIGFKREARGEIRAVARLDERRIIFTDEEIFEADGPGVDDNGNGDIGAPRRLPSDVGIYNRELGWRSIVECSIGILFQGLVNQIYLMPRGGVTPIPIGFAVQDKLAAFPVITSATYMPADQTVRFTCNNAGETDGIVLLFDVTANEWFVEGPFGAAITAGARFQGRFCMLRSNTVFQQRASHPPAAFIANAWRSGTIHPFGPGEWGRVYNFSFFGEYRSDCQLQCTVRYDDNRTETLAPVGVGSNAERTLTAGDPYVHEFTANQVKCESFRVDFDVTLPTFAIALDPVADSFGTASQAITVTLPAGLQIGDRLVLAWGAQTTIASSLTLLPTPSGWTRLNSATSVNLVGLAMFERIVDGTEQPSLILTAGQSTTQFTKVWVLRGHQSSTLSEAPSVSAGTTTTLDPIILSQSWGAASATAYLMAAIFDVVPSVAPNVTVFPTGFTGTGELLNDNPAGLTEGGFAWCSRIATLDSLDPTAFTYTQSGRSLCIMVAVRGAIIGEGLAYHYWNYASDASGKGSLKSPSQLS